MWWKVFAFLGLSVFLFGLWQWARSGAGIWSIFTIRRQNKSPTPAEEAKVKGEIRELERSIDRTLRASFKILGFLAILVWLMLGGSLLMRVLNVDMWLNNLSMRANRHWRTGLPDESPQSTPERQKMLRNIGAGLRK